MYMSLGSRETSGTREPSFCKRLIVALLEVYGMSPIQNECCVAAAVTSGIHRFLFHNSKNKTKKSALDQMSTYLSISVELTFTITERLSSPMCVIINIAAPFLYLIVQFRKMEDS